jgi:hypothetical protein
MQQIIDAINAAGKEVCIAKPPITLGNGPNTTPYTDPDAGVRSVLIKEYNEVIDELKKRSFKQYRGDASGFLQPI